MAERQRSLWAWGWRDKFPDETARKGLAQMVGALLPAAKPSLRELPTDEPALSEPRISSPDAIAAFTTARPYDRAARTRGRAFLDLVAGFARDYASAPDLVATPRDADEVVRVLELCEQHGWSVIPFGGGTSVVGGVDARSEVPTITLDLGALSGVHELDQASRLARIGGGTLGPRLEDELAPHGLTLRHFPQSF